MEQSNLAEWTTRKDLDKRAERENLIFAKNLQCLTPKWSCHFKFLSPSQLSTANFSLYKTYKIRHLVLRKCGLIKQNKLLKIKSKILSNLFNEKYAQAQVGRI